MAGLGRKTFSPGDVLTSSDVQGYLMDQSVMVFAGTAARASAIPSPSAGMVAYSTATALQVYNGTAWVDASTGYGSATGGTALATPPSGYAGLAFTADGTLTVTKAGLFDVFACAGGGAGGTINQSAQASGGGGAGGVLQTTIYLAATTHQVTIGAGGAARTNANGGAGNNGLATSIGSLLVVPGGGGGNGNGVGAEPTLAGVGGSGGGGGAQDRNFGPTKALGIVGLGNNGGEGTAGNLGNGAGGGGGQSAVGGNGSGSVGGAGGAGIDIATFTGNASTFKAGGGGGGRSNASGAGAGGSSVGGAGGSNAAGSAAAANTASGGVAVAVHQELVVLAVAGFCLLGSKYEYLLRTSH